MKSAPSLFPCLSVLVVIFVSLFSLPATTSGQLRLVEHASGFNRPLGMVQDPLDPSVQFVLEKLGVIWTLKNGVRLPEPFIDLTSVVMQDTNGERGLLSMVFP